jgi:hypothetical protein
LRHICWGWLWTAILLISASWVARITVVSHWQMAGGVCLITKFSEVINIRFLNLLICKNAYNEMSSKKQDREHI